MYTLFWGICGIACMLLAVRSSLLAGNALLAHLLDESESKPRTSWGAMILITALSTCMYLMGGIFLMLAFLKD
jgi:hypothetical protein